MIPPTYPKLFNEKSPYWSESMELNLLFIQAQQKLANNLLQVRGHVFLNEAYDFLGIPRTPEGQLVGWLSDGTEKTIQFGLYIEQENTETSIFLEFNVDGVMYYKIGEEDA